MAEIVDDGVTGYLVPRNDIDALAEALIRVLTLDAARASAMREAARSEASDRFGWRRVAAALEAVYAPVRPESHSTRLAS
jgi:glycosyltransferase involved in cell wall biosynthesis